jgi:hypothetical protein
LLRLCLTTSHAVATLSFESRVKGIQMLMAAPSDSRPGLELFRLALQLAEHDRSQVEAPLAAYFRSLVSQAKVLAQSSRAVVEPIMPDAVRLAVAIRNNKTFAEAIATVDDMSDLSPNMAATLRKSMEEQIAA